DFTKVDLKNLYLDKPPDESHNTLSGIVINLLILLADKSHNNHQLIEHILEKLYQVLIESIINFLPQNTDEQLIFVPQDFLFLIPFAALKDSQGKYFIEKYNFITVPTIHLLQTANTKQYKPDLLSMLIVAKDEINEEYNLFETAKITGEEATKSGVLKYLNDSKILHFSTDCYLYDKENLKYAIALTPDCTNNGLLSARDILTTSQYHVREIVTDLVVLSNCNPGYDYIWGNGMMEIILAWLSIGVNNVVSSLWLVPPPVKIFLFTHFYQFLSQNFDVSSAFRQAILITMKTYPHPQYWASFSLIQ
ncbi:MAG TPA: CHAT domain-containing protein, partial [Allocoleopsis sp.]